MTIDIYVTIDSSEPYTYSDIVREFKAYREGYPLSSEVTIEDYIEKNFHGPFNMTFSESEIY
jgi:hypothetical protein